MNFLFLELLQCSPQISSRRFLELRQPHVSDRVVEHLEFHTFDLDGVSDQGKGKGVRGAVPLDGQVDFGALRTAHFLHRIHQRQIFRGFVVHLGDEVTGFDPGPVGGRALYRRNDGQPVFLHADLNAHAAEFAFRLDLHLFVHFRRHIGGMGIQRRQHAANRPLHEVFDFGVVDIMFLHLRQHLGKGAQLFIGLGCVAGPLQTFFEHDTDAQSYCHHQQKI